MAQLWRRWRHRIFILVYKHLFYLFIETEFVVAAAKKNLEQWLLETLHLFKIRIKNNYLQYAFVCPKSYVKEHLLKFFLFGTPRLYCRAEIW